MTTVPNPTACNCHGTGSLYASEHTFGCPSRATTMTTPDLQAALIAAAIEWKRSDQPDKPAAVVGRWAHQYINDLCHSDTPDAVLTAVHAALATDPAPLDRCHDMTCLDHTEAKGPRPVTDPLQEDELR